MAYLYRTLEPSRLETLAWLGDPAAAAALAARFADAPQELRELERRSEEAECEAASLEEELHGLRHDLDAVVDHLRDILADTEEDTDPRALRDALRRYINRLES